MFYRCFLSVPLVLLLAVGCESPPDQPLGPGASSPDFTAEASPRFSAWSEPVNLGWPINTPGVTDGDPALSPNGLSLYHDSDRTDLPGARGARDIWVSRRACTDDRDPACVWQTPVNLGPLINTPHVDLTPELSDDGHLLFFASHTTRQDCPSNTAAPDPTRPCDEDIYVSWRADPMNDLAWETPVRLGPGVNTGFGENDPDFISTAEPGRADLYFSRAIGGTPRGFDIYSARIRITRRGSPSGPGVEVIGPSTPVVELNLPNVFDTGATVRADGRELLFASAVQRPGIGAVDLWTSTRRSPMDPWSAPVNPGTPLNSRFVDLGPSLSHDGRALFFTSNRQDPRGMLGWDIYMSTRTPLP